MGESGMKNHKTKAQKMWYATFWILFAICSAVAVLWAVDGDYWWGILFFFSTLHCVHAADKAGMI